MGSEVIFRGHSDDGGPREHGVSSKNDLRPHFMIRSTVAHVDLAALQANFKAIQKFLKEGRALPGPPNPPRIIAVVKANAYGHGAERVALALEAVGADLLACADIEEAVVLRRAGVRAPILIFGALSVSDLDGLFEFSLTPTISSPAAARAVQAAAAKHAKTIGYHLKIDTGMNRLGFRHDNLRRSLPDVLASPNLRLEAIFTHFATADEPETPFFDQQRANFEAAWRRSMRCADRLKPARVLRPRGKQRGDAAGLACLVRHGSSRAAAVWHRPAAAGVNDSADARHVADQPRRRGERCSSWRRRRIWPQVPGRQARDHGCHPGGLR